LSSPGDRLFRYLADLIINKFFGTVTVRFEAGKVTHVEAATRRIYEYGQLPDATEDRQANRPA